MVLTIELSNPGKTPAQTIYYCSELTGSNEYPKNLIKERLKKKEYQKTSWIFPNNKSRWRLKSNPQINEIDLLRDKIIEEIGNSLHYIHIFVKYNSESKDYFLKQTFSIEYIEEKNGKDIINWYPEYISFEPL